MPTRLYGFDPTNLVLTPKAEGAYRDIDLLLIEEQDDGLYTLVGIEDRHDLTAEQVNDYLEFMAEHPSKW